MTEKENAMMLASLSQSVADRDKVFYNIKCLFEEGYSEKGDNVHLLKNEFETLAIINMTIESIQLYYSKNLSIESVDEKTIKQQGDAKNDDNNS